MAIIDNIRDQAVTRLGGVTKAQASQRARRAYESGYQDGGEDEPVSGTVKRQGYKSLTSSSIRDLGGLDYDQVLSTVWALFLSNPVAARALKLKRDYILGRGIKVQADDDDLQAILDDFWAGNKLDARLKKFILQLHLLGAQCFPVFVREADGRVRLGYIDPSQIERVITHPDNVMEKWAVVIKENQGADKWMRSARDKRVYRIVREAEPEETEDGNMQPGEHDGRLVIHEQATLQTWESDMLAAFDLSEYTGSCFYFSVNELSNQDRGFSDLLQEADWLDQLDATLFALGDREHMADYFSFDVTLDGAVEEEINRRAAEFRRKPPKKGSVNVHNDKEHWNMNRPDLKQAGSIEASRTLLRFALGGLGMPEHWYAYGNETNRATADAQGTPTFRTMESEQDDSRDLILALVCFVRDQAIIAGMWTEKDAEIEVVMPEMTTKDMNTTAQALGVVAQALLTVESLGLITRETMARIWAKFVAEAGVEYDPLEELDKVDEQGEEEPLPGMTPDQMAAIAGTNGNQPPEGQTPPQLAPFAQVTKDTGGQ